MNMMNKKGAYTAAAQSPSGNDRSSRLLLDDSNNLSPKSIAFEKEEEADGFLQEDPEVLVKDPNSLIADEQDLIKDKYYMIYIIFLLLGIATLLPWNVFITAASVSLVHVPFISSAAWKTKTFIFYSSNHIH